MSGFTLQEIESVMAKVWSNPCAAEKLRHGRRVEGIPQSIQRQLTSPPVAVYQNSIWGHRFQFSRAIYPLTRKALGDKWADLIERFWLTTGHVSRDKFTTLNELPNFLRYQSKEISQAFPFICDLAEFERDMAIVFRSNTPITTNDFNPAQLLQRQRVLAPVVNETLLLRTYGYPVTRIAKRLVCGRAKDLRCDESATTVAIYQAPESLLVTVQQLGDAAAAIVLTAKSEPISYEVLAKAALLRLAEENSAELHKLVFATFEQLHKIGIFSATRHIG